MNFEMTRSFILLIGWPVLIMGSVLIAKKAIVFYQKTSKLALGKLIIAETLGTLISMYSLGIVSTFYMYCDVRMGVKVVLPIFFLWFLTMTGIYSVSRRWREEAGKINVLYYRIKERSEKLQREKSKLSHIAQNMDTGAILLDNEGKPMFINSEAKSIIGSKSENEEELLKKLYRKFAKYNLAGKAAECVSGQPSNIADAEEDDKIYEIFLRCLTDHRASSKGYFGHFIWIRDATEEKTLERAKNKFITVTSHKLRTPLTGIKNFISELLEKSTGKINEKQKDYLQGALQCAENVIGVVNQILYASEAEIKKLKIKPKKIKLDALIKKTIAKLKPFAKGKKKVVVFTQQKGLNAELSSDPSLIAKTLESVLDNAIIYSSDGKIEVSLNSQESDLIISIKDRGISIPEKDREKIFTRFFRAENAMKIHTEGMGISLSLARRMMESLNGRIWFKSEEGKGSTFYISLPVKMDERKIRFELDNA